MATRMPVLPSVCLATVLALAAGGLRAGELSAEERLEAVRQGLVQAALKGATQVQSTAWIDEDGVLRESSSFRSGMKVRGVRVLGYGRDESGQPKAQLQVNEGEDLLKPGLAGAGAACAQPSALRHVSDWRLQLAGTWSNDDKHLAQGALRATSRAWLQAGQGASRWRLATELPLTEPGAVLSPASPSAQYQRLLLGGAQAFNSVGWRAELRLEALPPWPVAEPKLPWLSAERSVPRGLLTLAVTAAGRPEPLLQAQLELSLQGEYPRWGPPQILPAVQSQIEEAVRGWAQRLDEQLACEPVNVQVVQVSGSRLKVDQGALAGMRPGEEWLLADRRLLPQRVLEPDATSQLVLARIDKVTPLQAELEVLAGPAARVQPRWQAWPMQAP